MIEIGSHYGAFLETAQQWGWRAEGVDIGKDTSRYARARGFTVHNKELSDCEFESESADAIFVWNCFATLERLIEPLGFRFELALNSELLALPLPEEPDWVAREERAINGQVHLLAGSVLRDQKGVLTGPWIELAFRVG